MTGHLCDVQRWSENYDGFGDNASGNNTLFFFPWRAF
jgi:hypothetical protein